MNTNLKLLRLSKKLSIKEMAKKLNIAPITYTRKENGEYPFTQNEINIILHMFGEEYEKIFNTNCHEMKHGA